MTRPKTRIPNRNIPPNRIRDPGPARALTDFRVDSDPVKVVIPLSTPPTDWPRVDIRDSAAESVIEPSA